MSLLSKEYTFSDSNSMATKFPCKLSKDNCDGTFQGYFDVGKMSNTQKILAMENITYNNIAKKLSIA